MPTHFKLRIALLMVVSSLLLWASCPLVASTVDSVKSFRPISPEELKMTSEPAAPGAPAIILYRNVYRDDSSLTSHEDNYVRIKILTEEGRKYGDVEIPFVKDAGNVINVHARTIKPDGSVVDFDGKVFNKTIVKARGVKFLAKTFTLPAVEVGSIIEYFYTIDIAEYQLVNSRWIISDELFTKAADFALKSYANPNDPFTMRWISQNMPSDVAKPIEGADKIYRVHVTNFPAFVTEDYMPPEDELKSRFDFIYSKEDPGDDPTRFWTKVGKEEYERMEKFVGKPKALESVVGQIVSPNDPPEVKLQKLYARVQQMRNTTYEVEKTEAEEKREKEKPATSAEEVWKHGYADGTSLTWLYLALVRAAGFDTYGLMVPSRANYFFYPKLMQRDRLDENVVLIKVNGKSIYCDPGAAFTPFGLLPWSEAGINGMQLDKKDPTWVQSLVLTSAEARTERRAHLTLSETGDLEGTVSVTYTGVEAAQLRLGERHEDDTARKKFLEDSVRGYIPAATEAKLTNQPEWKNSSVPLVAEFSVKVPGWAAGAGRHVLLPVGLFSAREKHLFEHADRVHEIYFEYPSTELDDVDIQLPEGWKVSSTPAGWTSPEKSLGYHLTVQDNHGKLHLSRTLSVDLMLLDVQYYSLLRHLFQEIKTSDDEQIVLDVAAARAEN